jgi:trk system potassium uptake protein TrkH
LTFLIASGLVMIFEGRPQLFLDHLFEVASAAGTVGVTSSTVLPSGEYVSITQSLSSPSRLVIIMTMFLGRVGPLTLLLALAGEAPAVRYEYPPERVTLG